MTETQKDRIEMYEDLLDMIDRLRRGMSHIEGPLVIPITSLVGYLKCSPDQVSPIPALDWMHDELSKVLATLQKAGEVDLSPAEPNG